MFHVGFFFSVFHAVEHLPPAPVLVVFVRHFWFVQAAVRRSYTTATVIFFLRELRSAYSGLFRLSKSWQNYMQKKCFFPAVGVVYPFPHGCSRCSNDHPFAFA